MKLISSYNNVGSIVEISGSDRKILARAEINNEISCEWASKNCITKQKNKWKIVFQDAQVRR